MKKSDDWRWRRVCIDLTWQYKELSLSARGIFHEMWLRADEMGRLYVGEDAVESVGRQLHLRGPDKRLVRKHLPELIEAGFIQLHDDHFALIGFEEANPQPPGNAQKTSVYVVGPLAGDIVKIGSAMNVQKRIASLQTGHPVSLELLAVMSGGVVEEKELHRRFAHLRVRGEWFQFAGELLDFVNGLPKEPS